RQRERIGAVADMECDQLGVAVMIDAPLGREWRHRRMHEAWRECGHRHQPCGSLSRMPMSASSCSITAWRSLVAVGSGDLVGPTGRPMMTMPPLSEDGY